MRDLRALARQLGSIVDACDVIRRCGYLAPLLASEATALPATGTQAAVPSRRRFPAELETRVVNLAIERPHWDPIRLANRLHRTGHRLSPGAVQGVLRRHRLGSIERRSAELIRRAACHGVHLSIRQIEMLVADIEEAEIHALRPGVEIAQDTLRVGQLPGIGTVYQQTALVVGEGTIFAKLYAERTPRCAVDLLEERVLPWCAARGRPPVALTTDRGTEFCGYLPRHTFESFLDQKGILHRWLSHRSPQHNPYCVPVHRRLVGELYRPGLHRYPYRSIYDLQQDLDLYLSLENQRRGAYAIPTRAPAARRAA